MGVLWKSPGCGACMTKSCTAAMAACRNDVTCSPSLDCLRACGGDEACRLLCKPPASADFAALAACQTTSCAADCDLSCGGLYGLYSAGLIALGPRIDGPTGACEKCLLGAKPACGAAATCAGSTSCLAAVDCEAGCSSIDLACYTSCVHLDEAGAIEALATAAEDSCHAACGMGTTFDCLGREMNPTPQQMPTLHIQVHDPVLSMPVAGAQVTACSVSSAACLVPLATATTDADGFFSITLSQPAWFIVHADQYLDALYFTVPSLVESTPKDLKAPIPIFLISSQTAAAFAALAGLTADMSQGIVLSRVFDCTGWAAPAVTFGLKTTSAGTKPIFLLTGNVPDPSATQTDINGTGGFFNVPPGTNQLSASTADHADYSVAPIVVRAGAVTEVAQYPTN
jgi:hypothetical protein